MHSRKCTQVNALMCQSDSMPLEKRKSSLLHFNTAFMLSKILFQHQKTTKKEK